MSTFKVVQTQELQLAGSGISATATSIVLKSFLLPDGETEVTMTDFGDVGFMTLEPGTSREEQISFTGITQNADGTATLTGVIRGLAFSFPYATDSTLKKSHAGSTIAVVSNTAGFYGMIKDYIDSIVNAGAADAATATKGITRLSTAPASPTVPIAVGTNDPRVPTQGENDAMVGTSGTPSSTNRFVTESDQTLGAGQERFSMLKNIPSGWLEENGQAVSRATYPNLWALCMPSQTVTITIASPGVFTAVGHGLIAGDIVTFTTTGGLPSGLTAGTLYYVISAGIGADVFRVSTSRGGSAVVTTGSQSGVHTLYWSNLGIGDGSTTFNLPNMKGYVPVGLDTADANFDAIYTPNTYVGEKTHQLTIAEMPTHNHEIRHYIAAATNDAVNLSGNGQNVYEDNDIVKDTGGDGVHNNIQPYRVGRWIIKY